MLAKIKEFVNNRDQRSWTKVKMKAKTFIAFIDRDQRSWTKVKMKAKAFIDSHQTDIILVIGVILISLLSFAMGYITAKQQEKELIKIEAMRTSFSSSPSLLAGSSVRR